MKTLSRKQMRLEHRRLWRWIAKDPMHRKADWPGWNRFGDVPCNFCFACLAAGGHFMSSNRALPNCKRCPIKWSKPNCDDHGAEYYQFCDARNSIARRAALALKIAEMWPEES
jgi:hypothetical protein